MRSGRGQRAVASALLSCVALCLLTVAGTAEAQGLEEARVHFARGVELFEKDDFVGAIEQFEAADQAHHTASITYNLARARESLGQAQAAHDAYEAYIGEAGAQGDYLDAATVALARIKSRSTKLRIESRPPGAVARVDGMPLRDRTPATVMVFKGKHRVDVQLDGWMEGRDVTVSGGGNAETVAIDRPPAKPVVAAPAPAAPKERHEFEGLTFGLGWSLNYTVLVVKAKPDETAAGTAPEDYEKSSIRFGLTLETGWALTPKHVLMLRGNCGLGSDQKALFSLGSLSPMLSYRATPRWWIGGGAIVASSEKNKGASYAAMIGADEDDTVRVSSEYAVGPVAELGLVLADESAGQWVLTLMPSLLLGTGQGQSTMFVPLVLGHRWY